MTNEQLYLAIGLPIVFNIVFNAALFMVFSHGINKRFDDMSKRLDDTNQRIDDLSKRFDKRFDDLRDLWRAELLRVEEVLDARLKRFEERS